MLSHLAIIIGLIAPLLLSASGFTRSSSGRQQLRPIISSPPPSSKSPHISAYDRVYEYAPPSKRQQTLSVLFGSIQSSNDYNVTVRNKATVPAHSKFDYSFSTNKSSSSGASVTSPTSKVVITLNTTSSKSSRKLLDNVTKFEQDVAVVIKDIRAGEDATLPELFRHGTKLSLSNLWTSSEWERHMSRWRFVRYMLKMHKSRLLRRILPQFVVTVLWSMLVFQAMATQQAPAIMTKVDISLTSLSLVSSFIAALVTLRSNEGLRRLSEARNAWMQLVSLLRDTAQLLGSYISPYDMELGLLSARHLAMFGWLLKSQLRDESSGDVVAAMLSPSDAAYVLSQRKRPAALILRIRQIVGFMAGKNRLPYPAHQAVENNLLQLNIILGHCERIKTTCIPPLYTAHVSRLLVLYLFFLPFALQGTGINIVANTLMTGSIGFSMLGLDEISHQLEQPFRLMPLQQLSVMAMRDVADVFVCPPPKLRDKTISTGDTDTSTNTVKTPIEYPRYW